MHTSLARNALILGLITAIGPFAIDMYLPVLPAIGDALGADSDTVLLSLTAYFISFGFFQLAFGAISDIYGRKAPLYAGLALFVAASIGCALANNIETLIAMRFLQGIGGAAGIIIARAIVRDLYSGVEEVRMISLLMLVFSVSPLLAPLAGSYVVDFGGWRAVFLAVAFMGVMGIGLIATNVGETLPPERRIRPSLTNMMRAYRILFTDARFMGLTMIGTFAISAFFIYLGNSPFVLTEHYGLSAREYSIAFSVNAAAFFIAAQFNGYLGQRFGMARIMAPAAIGFASIMTALAVMVHMGVDNLFLISGVMFAGNMFVGVLLPTASVLGLEEHGEIAGMASSLMGTMQLAVGSLAIAVSGALSDGTPGMMITGIALMAVVSLGFTLWTTRKL